MTNKEIQEFLEANHKYFPSRMTSDEIRKLETLKVYVPKDKKHIKIPVRQTIEDCESALDSLKNYLTYLPTNVTNIIWTFHPKCKTAFTDGKAIAMNPVFAYRQLQLSIQIYNTMQDMSLKIANHIKLTPEEEEDRPLHTKLTTEDKKCGIGIAGARYFLFVIMHEYYHMLYRHIEKEQIFKQNHGKCDHDLANEAEDIEINRDIEVHFPVFTGACTWSNLLWYEDYLEYCQTDAQKQTIYQGSWDDIYRTLQEIGYQPERKPQKGNGDGPKEQNPQNQKKKRVYTEEVRKAAEEAFRRRTEELHKEFPDGPPVTYEGDTSMFDPSMFESRHSRFRSLFSVLNESAVPAGMPQSPDIEYVTMEDAIKEAEQLAEDLFFGRVHTSNEPDEGDNDDETVNSPNYPGMDGKPGKKNGKGDPSQNSGKKGENGEDGENGENGENGEEGDEQGDGNGQEEDDDTRYQAEVVEWDDDAMDEDMHGKNDMGSEEAADIMREITKVAQPKNPVDTNPRMTSQEKISRLAAHPMKKLAQRPTNGTGRTMVEVYEDNENLYREGDIDNWRDRLRPFFNTHTKKKKEPSKTYAKYDLMGTELEGSVHLENSERTYSVTGGIMDVVFIVDNSGSMQFKYNDEEGKSHSVFTKILNEILQLEYDVKVKHSALVYFAAEKVNKEAVRRWDRGDLADIDGLIDYLQRANGDMTGGTDLKASIRSMIDECVNDYGKPLLDSKTTIVIISDGGDQYEGLQDILATQDIIIENQCIYLLYGTDNKTLIHTASEISKEAKLPHENIIMINVAKEYNATAVPKSK